MKAYKNYISFEMILNSHFMFYNKIQNSFSMIFIFDVTVFELDIQFIESFYTNYQVPF